MRNRIAIVVLLVASLAVGLIAWSGSRRGPRSPAFHAVRTPIAQTLLVTGRIAPSARVLLGAMAQSTVVDVAIEEGDVVEAGTLLVRLADDEASARARESKAQVDEAAARPPPVAGRRAPGRRRAPGAGPRASGRGREQYARAAALFAQGF